VTLFEYVAVAASLVCSFAAARVLGGLAAVLRPDSRYWVHAVWVVNVLFGICLAWWLFWSYREVDWNFLRFLLALSPLAIIYVVASLVVPADAESVPSWRKRYFDVRVRFFVLNLAYLAANFVNTVVLLGHPMIHRQRILVAGLAALFSAGAVSPRPKLHAAIVLVFTVCNVMAAFLSLRPGSFGAGP
jgi:hypothetical protein